MLERLEGRYHFLSPGHSSVMPGTGILQPLLSFTSHCHANSHVHADSHLHIKILPMQRKTESLLLGRPGTHQSSANYRATQKPAFKAKYQSREDVKDRKHLTAVWVLRISVNRLHFRFSDLSWKPRTWAVLKSLYRAICPVSKGHHALVSSAWRDLVSLSPPGTAAPG